MSSMTKNNEIHPTAILSGEVRLGHGNRIGPNCIIEGPVELGDHNWIGGGAVIGAMPEVRSLDHFARNGVGGVRIGDRTVIREASQIHQGWNRTTEIGNDVFIMNQSYVAHDCVIGDFATLASSVLLAGHVSVGEGANLGLGTKVHQFRVVGAGCIVGMGSVVSRDLPAISKAYGAPAKVRGANIVGLERLGATPELIALVKEAYADDSKSNLELQQSFEIEWLTLLGATVQAATRITGD